MNVHHLNCGLLHAPPNPKVACHCLLLEDAGRLALIDTGIGLLDVANPSQRIGQPLIDLVGFQFHEHLTAARQIEQLGFTPADVTDIVLTHCDPDHTGGLADFPSAAVHVSQEELAQAMAGHWRYLPAHFAHQPRWVPHSSSSHRWFDLEARPVPLFSDLEVLLVPLFGHTLGHCGVAVCRGDDWLLHVGDAYYLRVELASDDHPVSAIAAQRADNDELRRQSLASLRRLASDHTEKIAMFCYHDLSEMPD